MDSFNKYLNNEVIRELERLYSDDELYQAYARKRMLNRTTQQGERFFYKKPKVGENEYTCRFQTVFGNFTLDREMYPNTDDFIINHLKLNYKKRRLVKKDLIDKCGIEVLGTFKKFDEEEAYTKYLTNMRNVKVFELKNFCAMNNIKLKSKAIKNEFIKALMKL